MAKINWIFVYFLMSHAKFINGKSNSCTETSEPLTDRNPMPVVGETFFASEHLLNSQNTNLNYFKSVFTLPDKYKQISKIEDFKSLRAKNVIISVDNIVLLNNTEAIIEADEVWLSIVCAPYLHNIKRFHYKIRNINYAEYINCNSDIVDVLQKSDTSLLTVLDVSFRKGTYMKLQKLLSAVSDAKLEVLSINGFTVCTSALLDWTDEALNVTEKIKYLSLTDFVMGYNLNEPFFRLFICLQVLDLSNSYVHTTWITNILSFHPTLELFTQEDKTNSKENEEFTNSINIEYRRKSANQVCFGGKYRKGFWMTNYDFNCDNSSDIMWNKTFQEYTLKNMLFFNNLPEVKGLYFKPDSSCSGGMRVPIAPKLQELYIEPGGLAVALLTVLENTWWLESVGTENKGNVCLQKNNLKTFHVSSELFAFVSNYLFNISTFSGLEKLSELYLNQMSFNNIPEYLLKHKYFPNLTILNINRNNITFKEEFQLCNAFRSLANFSMSSNGLSFMPVSIFRDCSNLVSLDLSLNLLHTLPNALFSGCKRLLTLDISFNLLRSLPQSLFHGCGQLQFVDLSYNFLHRIPQTLTSELEDYHMLIDLSHNALSCDCHPDAIGTLLHLHNNKHRYHNHQTYQCNGLGDVQLMLDVDLKEYTRSCVKWLPHEVALLTAGCCATFFAFWISVWLLVRFRYRVVTCMYRARTCLQCGKRPIYESRPVMFAFDLYLVYCNEDREWVHRSLVDALETKHGFNCCVHYRDFPGTGQIDDVILKYMRYSRDIVVVLSSNSINKQWPSFEIKNAQLLERCHGKRIFYIKLGSLGESIPERVQRILGSRIYMEWPEQETETSVSHFYEKLVATIYGKAMCGSCCSCFRSRQILTPYDNLSTTDSNIPLRAMTRN